MNNSDIAIRTAGLGKMYALGERLPYGALRDEIARLLALPFRGGGMDPRSRRGQVWAIKDLSFEVARGEVVGIIGRNGAGKTTLLRVLSRITEPTEGSAEIRGRVGSLLEVGTGFHPELTGRENVYLNGAILGMRKREIDDKFDAIVAFSEVERFMDTPVKRYSAGMHVRLAFAVAAHLEPEILLVDEVLAVGDFKFQKKCMGKMNEVSRQGRTVLFVSHNMSSIATLCDRAIFLDSGKVVAEGAAMDVVRQYMASLEDVGSEMVWESPSSAPGNDSVRLHSIRIVSGSGQARGELDLAEEVIVEISYWCLKDGASPVPSFWLRNEVGIAVLESNCAAGVSLTDDEWYDRPHPVGLYRSACRLPSQFLNDGVYSVTAGMMGMGTFGGEDIVSFRMCDSGTMPKHNPWMGVVRPRLAWNTEYLGETKQT
jgi:lipopolysaccharide transport system ATP-binding protein